MAKRSIGLSNTLLAFDVLATAIASYAILALFRHTYWPLDDHEIALGAVVFLATALPTFLLFRIQKQIWRFVSASDLPLLIAGSGFAIGGGSTALYLSGLETAGSHLFFLTALVHWAAVVSVLTLSRRGWQWLVQTAGNVPAGERPAARFLLFHAGFECDLFLQELSLSGNRSGEVVGIVDAKPDSVGRSVRGVEILCDLKGMPGAIAALTQKGRRPTEIVLTRLPTTAELSSLAETAKACGLRLTALHAPGATNALVNNERLALEPKMLQAITRRNPVTLDRNATQKLITDRRILVTGAGGSIGSELVEMIARQNPARLDLVDNSEFNLWRLQQRLQRAVPGARIHARIGDIRDAERLKLDFARARPELVFHTAALKHVPVVEANVVEGVKSNVIGTANVAQAVLACGAKAMVQVSTDKAVNPSSVMGATKRLAEMYCQHLDAATPDARFLTVRFGNVLGSSGSVVPIFQRQIQDGGPVTITHPDMVRYFMTIAEACELVLHSAAHSLMGGGPRGIINVLDMGKPVRIIDIARQMIILNGKIPEEEIRIETTGIRPGEKLVEELFDDSEVRIDSQVPGVLAARPAGGQTPEIAHTVEDLRRLVQHADDAAIRVVLQSCVPGYARQLASQAAA